MRAFSARVVLALAVVALIAPRALADKKEAIRFTEQGKLAYQVGHFQEALDFYSNAYEAFPAPLLLFNLGQCHRELTNYERAIFFLRGYLREAPRTKNRALVQDLIAECERKLAAQEDLVRRRDAEAHQQQLAALPEASQMTPPSLAVSASPVQDRVALMGERHSGQRKEAVGLSLAAVGAAAVGVGIYFAVRTADDTASINRVATSGGNWTATSESTYLDGTRSATLADILYVGGGAVLAAGALVAILGYRQDALARSALSFTAAPRPGGASASLAWRY